MASAVLAYAASTNPIFSAVLALPIIGVLLLLVPVGFSPAKAAYRLYTSPVFGPLLHRLFLAAGPTIPHRDGLVVVFGGGTEDDDDEEDEDEGSSSVAFSVVAFATQTDNISYLLVDASTGSSALVDAADPVRAVAHVRLVQRMWDERGAGRQSSGPLIGDEVAFPLGWTQSQLHTLRRALRGTRQRPVVTHVLSTHRHMDHAGGNPSLRSHFPSAAVFEGNPSPPPRGEGAALAGRRVCADFAVGNTRVAALAAPCHTRDSVLLVAGGGGGAGPAVFTGDTLFCGGVGKFFEGDPEEMAAVLDVGGPLGGGGGREDGGGGTGAGGSGEGVGVLPHPLPSSARLFFGHEYAPDQLAFAAFIEPDNEGVRSALAAAQAAAARREFYGVGGTLDEERARNPYLRASSKAVAAGVTRVLAARVGADAAAAGALANVPSIPFAAVVGALRELKNDGAHKRKGNGGGGGEKKGA
jgi:hydroxyacylglutathione hydrolase